MTRTEVRLWELYNPLSDRPGPAVVIRIEQVFSPRGNGYPEIHVDDDPTAATFVSPYGTEDLSVREAVGRYSSRSVRYGAARVAAFARLGDSEIEVLAGDRFFVEVPVLAAAGYEWSVEKVEGAAKVTLTGDQYRPGYPMEIGSPGTQRFTFLAGGAGSGSIHLSMKRPWETEPAERRRFEFTVRVGE